MTVRWFVSLFVHALFGDQKNEFFDVLPAGDPVN